jgi:citrate synthase
MSATIENGVNGGLEGVVAFATEIAEPDRAGGALRYRGVDVEELVGRVPFEQVWGLLVDGTPLPGLARRGRSGGRRPRVRATRGASCRPRSRGFRARPLIDLDASRRARARGASVATLELAAQIARAVAPVRPPR